MVLKPFDVLNLNLQSDFHKIKGYFIDTIHNNWAYFAKSCAAIFVGQMKKKRALHFIANGREIGKIKEKTQSNNNNRFIFDIMTAKRILMGCLKGSMRLRCQIHAFTQCVCVLQYYQCHYQSPEIAFTANSALSICIKLRQIHRSSIHMAAYSISYARTKKKAIEREKKLVRNKYTQSFHLFASQDVCALELSCVQHNVAVCVLPRLSKYIIRVE